MMRDGCQEAIYKIRAQSKRTVYVRLCQTDSLTLFLSDMNKSGHTATGMTEEVHKEKVSCVVEIFVVVLHDFARQIGLMYFSWIVKNFVGSCSSCC